MDSLKYRTHALVAIAIIILLGFVAVTFFTRDIDRTQRAELLKQVHYASLLVSPEDIASLTATDADLDSPVYQRLKRDFMAFRSFNDQIRFVYLMGYRPEIKTQFFYVDSEPTTSEDYSPPGQLFPDTRQSDIDQYLAGEPYTDGPYRDSWGQWVSGSVMIHDNAGAVVGMVGIDIATSTWNKQIGFVRIVIAIITLLLATMSYVFFRYLSRKQSSIAMLEKQNMHLIQDKSKLSELQALAHIGRFGMYLEDQTVMLDEQFAPLFGVAGGVRFPLQQFRAMIHMDDRARFDTALGEITSSPEVIYNWFDIRIGTGTQGYRVCHFYGVVERNASGKATRFTGTIQDVTDIKG